jgi:hypothetical protein
MQEQTETINLSDIQTSRLPFCYRKIHLTKLPPRYIDKKLMLYNQKYKFNTMQVLSSNKPISKILQ